MAKLRCTKCTHNIKDTECAKKNTDIFFIKREARKCADFTDKWKHQSVVLYRTTDKHKLGPRIIDTDLFYAYFN